MVNHLDLLLPYRQSAAYDDTEKALQRLFIDVFTELFSDQIEDIHHYGMPHFGSPKVVERFTKQDGLVVLRRPTSSDLIMRVIYANWRSLASRRGLAFLEFVLQMIWSDKWEIQRLYHSKARSSRYPSLVTPMPTRDSFLTSRIMIVLAQDVDPSEVLELTPIISKLVPANIVANIAVSVDFGEMNPLAVSAAYMPYMFGNFQDFDPLESSRIPWTDWSVKRTYTLVDDVVRYSGSKTDLVTIVTGSASLNLRNHALTAMSNHLYNQLPAVFQVVLGLNAKAVACEVDTLNSVVKASIFPETPDDLLACEIIRNRVIESSNGDFVGNDYFPSLMRNLNWIFVGGVFYYSIPADLALRSPLIYTVVDTDTVGYYSHLDTAQKHIAYLLENNPDWSTAKLQNLELKGSDDEVALFVQYYTVPIIPTLSDWQIDQSIALSVQIATYTGFRTDGHIYYDSHIDFDLTVAITRSLSDADMQQEQVVIDVVNELTNVTDWSFDSANGQVKYLQLNEEKTITFDAITQAIISNAQSVDQATLLPATAYIEVIANGLFEDSEAKQFVKLIDLDSQLIANQVLRSEEPEVPYELARMTYEFKVIQSDNPDFIGIDTSESVPVGNSALVNMFVDLRAKAVHDGDSLLLQNLDFAVKSAYQKDPLLTETNALYDASLIDISFLDIVNQIFIHANTPLSLGYPSAYEYLSKIIETVYLPDVSNQFIKLSDLIAQFEESKVQNTLS